MSNTKETALNRFIQQKSEFDGLLQRIITHSDEHFGLQPDAINWGHVGNMGRYLCLLHQISDAMFSEGEHNAKS